ncbi:hypothetical protein [Chloroflexus sp.]|uniref:hypothetical protein n=1 Tax=Chloroflexus sp. TaxID=1904827 RepID=UPI002ACD590A|nr:hypothetical protein [Chloroflexus sp.]
MILARTLAQRAGWGRAIGVGALCLAIVLDPVRMAFGAEAAFVALALAYPLTIAVQA